MSLLSGGSAAEPPHRRLLVALLLSGLAGLVLAAAALPLVGGLGLTAKAAANTFEDLPADLEAPPLPQRSVILASDGTTVLATIYLNQNRVVVPLADIPQSARNAIVAIEDSRFYEHNGIDLQGLLRAAVTNSQAGQVRQGGSTLTQQYVKNVLLLKADTPEGKAAATEQSLGRKLREARYALALEKRLPKDEILGRYLNIANFGDGVYGIGTAAQHYFSKPVQQLTLPESALLAGLVQNPEGFNPVRHPDRATERRNVVLERMQQLGYVTSDQARVAILTPLTLALTETRNGCEGTIAPFFCRYLIEQAQDDPAFGATQDERVRRIFQGGLRIVSTMDLATQQASQQTLEAAVPRSDRFGTAAVVMEPGTGAVTAMAENRTYGTDTAAGETKVNYATGGSTGFQAGSTFKTFVLAAALEQGIPLDTQINAQEKYHSLVLANGPDGFVSNAESNESGEFDLAKATWLSVNTAYLPLEERVGVIPSAKLAQRVGLTGLPVGTRIQPDTASFTLGTSEVSPLAMADAYATFAAHGVHCEPRVIASVATANGSPVAIPRPQCSQVLSPSIADAVANVLTGVITQGTGQNAAIDRPLAGKTGTTQDFNDAWFVGFTPQRAAAVWLGYPDNNLVKLNQVTIGGRYYSRVYGGGLPATMFSKIMRAASKGLPVADFPQTDRSLYSGDEVSVPDVTGMTAKAAAGVLTQAGLGYEIPGSNGNTDLSSDTVTVTGQSPRAGRSAQRGFSVQLYTSGLRSSGSSSAGDRQRSSRSGSSNSTPSRRRSSGGSSGSGGSGSSGSSGDPTPAPTSTATDSPTPQATRTNAPRPTPAASSSPAGKAPKPSGTARPGPGAG